MAEVGLVLFARVALEVASTALPRYRSRFSKHQFTQPQLRAVLCLMRYQDWTYREAEVRLREHSELRRAVGLGRVPDHTTLYRFLCRLPPEALAAALAEVARRFPRRGRARIGRERLLPREAQTLGPRPGPIPIHAAPLSGAARLGLQPLPVVASPNS